LTPGALVQWLSAMLGAHPARGARQELLERPARWPSGAKEERLMAMHLVQGIGGD